MSDRMVALNHKMEREVANSYTRGSPEFVAKYINIPDTVAK